MGKQILGFLLILFGLFFLAGNMDWFEPSFFLSLLQFWPLLLIAAGLDQIFKKTQFKRIGTTVLGVFLLSMLALGVYTKVVMETDAAWNVGPWQIEASGITTKGREQITQRDSVKLPTEAKSVHYQLDFGAGSMVIDSLASNEWLLKSEFETSAAAMPVVAVKEGRETKVEVKQNSHNWFPYFGRFERESWQLFINEDLPASFEINTGASDTTLNLTSIPVEKLDLNTGAATVNMTLGLMQPKTEMSIDCGASSITIRIPDKMGVSVNFEGGLSTLDLPDDFTKLGSGLYESENYRDELVSQLMIEINSGAATIHIERYTGDENVKPKPKDEDEANTDPTQIDFTRLTGGAMNPIDYDKTDSAVFIVSDYLKAHSEAARLETILDVYREPGADNSLELLVLQGQKNTGGYAINTRSVRLVDESLTITVALREPGRQGFVTQALTSPYEVISLDAKDLPDGPFTIDVVDSEGDTLATTTYGDQE